MKRTPKKLDKLKEAIIKQDLYIKEKIGDIKRKDKYIIELAKRVEDLESKIRSAHWRAIGIKDEFSLSDCRSKEKMFKAIEDMIKGLL